MAVSCPLISDGRVVGVLRMVTSLRGVDFQILMAVSIVVLMLITYVPWFSLFIPNLMYGG